MKKLFFIIGLLFTFTNCNIREFGNGVKSDANKRLKENKQFFREIGFNGTIETMRYMDKSDVAPYRLTLKIENLTKDLTISNFQTPPYYSFDSTTNPKKLELSVSEEIYTSSKKGDRVIKLEKSDSIQVGNTKYQLLNSTEKNWN